MIEWTPGQTLEQIEKLIIQQASKFYHNNHYVVARALKIENEYLTKRLKLYEQQNQEEVEKQERRQKIVDDFQLRARGISPKDDLNLPNHAEIVNPPLEIYHSRQTIEYVEKKSSKKQETKYAE